MIRLENVSKSYETTRGHKTVLHEVNLQIDRGETGTVFLKGYGEVKKLEFWGEMAQVNQP